MIRRTVSLAALGCLLTSIFVVAPAGRALAAPAASTEQLMAPDADGNGELLGAYDFAISADDQKVVLTTGERLDPVIDNDLSPDVYEIDRSTGTATLATLDTNGQNGLGDAPSDGGMTADGSEVVFEVNDDYANENSQEAHADVYLRDVGVGTTRRLSTYTPGYVNIDPRITPDGRYVVYTRGLYGSSTSEVIRQDVASGDQIVVAAHGTQPSISDDGSEVAYWNSTNDDPNDTDAHAFVATIDAGGNVSTQGIDGGGTEPSLHPALSPDGNYVAFESRDTSLSPDLSGTDPVFGPWIFVRNLTNGDLELASRRSDGLPLGHAALGGTGQQFSGDDRYLTFLSGEPLTYNGHGGVALHDRETGRTTLQSIAPDGSYLGSQLGVDAPIVSADGTTVVFGADDGAYASDQANAPDRAPVAALSQDASGLQAFFDASHSYDPDSTIDYDHIVSYGWDFNGDGVIDDTTTVPYHSFTYPRPGTYQATVTVTDGYGLTDTATVPTSVDTPYDAAVKADSPLSFYRLGEAPGATMAVDQTGAHNGAYSGNVTLGIGGAINSDGNTAARFDGLRAAVSLPAPETTIGTNFSVEAWVRTTHTDKSAYVATASDGTALRAVLATDSKFGTSLRFVLRDDARHAVTVASTVPINNGAYHYVVAERSGNVLELYIDEALVATKALPKTFGSVTINRASIGAEPVAGRAKFGNGFAGDVDEVAFYNQALTPAQIQSHFQAAGNGGGTE